MGAFVTTWLKPSYRLVKICVPLALLLTGHSLPVNGGCLHHSNLLLEFAADVVLTAMLFSTRSVCCACCLNSMCCACCSHSMCCAEGCCCTTCVHLVGCAMSCCMRCELRCCDVVGVMIVAVHCALLVELVCFACAVHALARMQGWE
jgi:hypothetical protein